ncbi:DUF2142 domain-containing protein [Nocardioides cavernae]|uniref:DUF2142 domain-containing protein n=1 Tax=Nocardioides cavernae TaxID=1921566 RepID=A0ABR8NEV3_9ACTN|nr:DUF2142 domain-containing protein [Nocardioides cavernae]MBD3926658.1 DUF2142 domain-containing protein [Nocardioides cavernae]MBM7512380.1 hypothetical protein [Nocardioides cavernae]
MVNWLVVTVCVLGSLLAGTGWALSSPSGSSPDEDFHLGSIWCADSSDESICDRVGTWETGGPIVQVPALVTASACYAGDSAVSGECQEDVIKRGIIETIRVNKDDYPGGFYRVMHVFAGEDIRASVLTMRLFNVALAVALFTALALSGTRATRRIQLYTLSAIMIPLGWFLIASVNPSGWAVTGVTAFGFGLHSAFLVRGRARLVANIVLAGVGAALGMLARGDAAVYTVIVALSVCLLHWRTLMTRRKLLLVPAVAVVVCAAVALTSGQVASIATPEPETPRSGAEVLVQLATSFPLLGSGIFGFGWGLGWLDTYMPALTVCSVMYVVGFLGLAGLRRLNVGKALAVTTLGGAFIAIPLLTLYRARLFVGEAVQPRYVLPLAPILLLLLLTGRRAGRGYRLGRWQALAVWALLSAANSAALYTNMWRYVTGTDQATLFADTEWWWGGWWPDPVAMWVISSLGFACFAASVVWVSRRGPGRTPSAASSDRDSTRAASA